MGAAVAAAAAEPDKDEQIEVPIIVGHNHNDLSTLMGWARFDKSKLHQYIKTGAADRIYFAPAFIVKERKNGVITDAELLEISLMVDQSRRHEQI